MSTMVVRLEIEMMIAKLVVLTAMVVCAKAGVPSLHTPYSAPPVAVANVIDTEYDPNPQYTYSYGVEDAVTGDSKSQTETRHGDVVTGQYSLVDPDGTRRIVDYTADPIHGFNAVVRKTPLTLAAPVVTKPVVTDVAAPVSYSTNVITTSPITKTVVAGPSALSYAVPHLSFPARLQLAYAGVPFTRTLWSGVPISPLALQSLHHPYTYTKVHY